MIPEVGQLWLYNKSQNVYKVIHVMDIGMIKLKGEWVNDPGVNLSVTYAQVQPQPCHSLVNGEWVQYKNPTFRELPSWTKPQVYTRMLDNFTKNFTRIE